MTKPLTQLTELEVTEVSFVDRGAIGETFTVIKSEDDNSDLINKYNNDELCNKLSSLSDEQFVEVMRTMMSKYNELNSTVNKGGEFTMGEEQVKQLIADVVGAAMESVNKNFAQVNKAIDDITKSVEEKAKTTDDSDKKTDEEVVKAVAEIGGVVKSLAETVSGITKSLEGLGKIEETVGKLATQGEDVTKRLENIEKMENPSNDASNKEDVNKNDGDGKEPFWKSFFSQPQA